jgi:CDP-diacylglycerol--glycerol-3-phosphate 3-phosphatidyltransferase
MSDKVKKSKMNLPNKLTVFRVILIVPFVLILLGGFQGWGWVEAICGGETARAEYIALAIFIVASLTDLLDGKIARKYNLVTNFGKFMDPLADKLLVCAAMIVLVEMSRIPSWVVIVIISREFIISGFRLIASDNGVVIAASYWGKFKTTFQMIMICMMIVKDAPFLNGFGNQDWFATATDVIMWIALALTIISLADYLIKNREVMSDVK